MRVSPRLQGANASGGWRTSRLVRLTLVAVGIAATAAIAATVASLWGDDASRMTSVDAFLAIVLTGMVSSQLLLARMVLRRLARVERRVREEAAAGSKKSSQMLETMRTKQSRHEYIQESALSRIEGVLAVLRSDVEGQVWAASSKSGPSLQFVPKAKRLPRVLFVTSNGAGLGHLTRCLAVASHSQELLASAIVTQSTAHTAVASLGYDVGYFPSFAASDIDWPEWHRRFARYMHTTLATNAVDAVVFDGAWIYRGVTEACRRLDVPLIWMRRGTWKPESDRTQFNAPLRYCDFVIEPRDGAFQDSSGAQNPDWFRQCDPISLIDPSSALGSTDAKVALGLEPSQRYVLVQLGAGNINDVSSVRDRVVEIVRAEGAGRIPVIAVPSIAAQAVQPVQGVPTLQDVYPLGKYLSAFDFGICAAGYNTVNENLNLQFPAVYVPNVATATDDQVARARAVAHGSLGLCGVDETEIAAAVRAIMAEGALDRLGSALRSRRTENGASVAGEIIAQIVHR